MSAYNGESVAEIEERMSRRQKMLIPVNIVVMILSLVAAFSLIVSPLVTIDLNGLGDKVQAVMPTEGDESYDATMDSVTKMLNGLDYEFTCSTFDLIGFVYTENKNEYVAEKAAEVMDEVADTVLVNAAVVTVINTVNEQNPDLKLDDVDTDKLIGELKKLETAQPEELDSAVSAFARELQNQLGSTLINEDDIEMVTEIIREMYDETILYTEDGRFTVEAGICVAISKILSGAEQDDESPEPTPEPEPGSEFNPDESEPNALASTSAAFAATESGEAEGGDANSDGNKVYTSYEELISAVLGGETSTSDEDMSAVIAEYMDIAANYVQYAVYVIFGFAGVWLLLFLSAFLHLLLSNKRFTMWYAKVFGGIPCLVLGVLPALAKFIVGTVLQYEALAALIGIISTTVWISGACYLLMWIVSVFWAHPIKKRIRADKEQLWYAKRAA